MKKLRILFIIMAVLLSDIMCAVVAYAYRGMLCGINHLGYCSPAEVAFLYAIPFGAAILVCVILASFVRRKVK